MRICLRVCAKATGQHLRLYHIIIHQHSIHHSEFNITQQVDAFLGEPSVRSVRYDPLEDPTRVSVEFATARRDTAPANPSAPVATVDVRRAELFINNRRSQQPSDNVFVAAELYRQVVLAVYAMICVAHVLHRSIRQRSRARWVIMRCFGNSQRNKTGLWSHGSGWPPTYSHRTPSILTVVHELLPRMITNTC